MITKPDTRPDDNYQEYKSETEAGNGQLIDKQVHRETSNFNKRK